MFLRPGQLTLEWLRGRRVPYVRPLQLFLLANLVYFVVQPLTGYNGYNTTLSSQMNRQFYSEPLGIAETVRTAAARRGLSLEVFEAAYDAKSEMLAKTLVLVTVPLFAPALAIVNGRRGRPAAQHLIFALHYFAWELLFVATAFLLTELPTAFLLVPYLYFALCRVYGGGRLANAAKAFVLVFAEFAIRLGYRLILFRVTMLAV